MVQMIIVIHYNNLMSRVFANVPGDPGSIPDRVIPKTQKWYLMSPCLTLSIFREASRVKRSNPGNGIAPSNTSVWKLLKRKPSRRHRRRSPTLLNIELYNNHNLL